MNKNLEKLKERWESTKLVEKVFLIVLVLGVIGMAIYSIGAVQEKKEKAIRVEIESYKSALKYLSEHQLEYQKNLREMDETREKLLGADSKLVSTLMSMASNQGFDVTVNPKESHKDDSGVDRQEIDIEVKNADYTKFIQYMVNIEKLESPLYMRNIKMTRQGTPSTSETRISASITLVSYRLKEQNAQ